MARNFSFPPPPTPSGLVLTEAIVAVNNRAVHRLSLSWSNIPGVRTYTVAYFFFAEEEDGPQGGLPPQKIDNNYTVSEIFGTTFDIDGLGRGFLSLIIYSLNSNGLACVTPLRTLIRTQGKTAPPENVSGFRVESQGLDFVRVNWTKSTENDVLHGGFVEIRYTSLTSGATWEGSFEVAKIAGNSTEVVLNTEADGTFLAKFVDDGGRKSATEVTSVFTQPVKAYAKKEVGAWREDTYSSDWVGLTTTYLTADSSSNMSLVNGSDKTEGIKLTDATTKTGTYCFALGWYLGHVSGYETPFTYSVERHIKMTTFYSTDAFGSRGKVQSMENFSGAKAPNVNVRFFYKKTLSDANSKDNATWTNWTEFTATEIRGTGFVFKVVVETTDPAQNIKITELGVNFSMPFRTLSSNSVTYSANSATTDITYSVPFWGSAGIPNVQVTPLDLASGEYYVVSSSDGFGFTLAAKQANGSAVSADRTFSYSASGYGYMA